MTARKSSTTRKGLAIGLAVIGIAGLSLASAAQLNLTGAGGTLQAGSHAIVNADCQTADIPVKFAAPTMVAGVYKASQIDLTDIDSLCSGKSYKLSVLTSANVVLGSEKSGTVTTVVGPATSALFMDISALSTAQVDSIARVSLTIYS